MVGRYVNGNCATRKKYIQLFRNIDSTEYRVDHRKRSYSLVHVVEICHKCLVKKVTGTYYNIIKRRTKLVLKTLVQFPTELVL